MITLTVTASANGGATTLYLKSAAVAGTLSVTWDMGIGGATITAVTLTDQACTGAGGTCP